MSNVILPVRIGLCGFYRLKAGKPGQKPRVDTGWFPNLITNQGLDFIGDTDNYLNACQVGTGNAAPAFTDAGLAAYLAGTTTKTNILLAAQSSAPYYTAETITFQFAAGTATGNLSEVGVGTSETGSTLFSRALILDGSGNPTTITVLPDEVLEVTYQLRVIPPTNDVIANVTDSGPEGTVYTFTIRPANVTFATETNFGWSVNRSMGVITNSLMRAFNGAIGTVTGGPSGTSSSDVFPVIEPYSAGSLERIYKYTFSLANGNLSGGISAIRFTFGAGSGGTWQAGISPAIPKDNTKTLSITTKVSWARETI